MSRLFSFALIFLSSTSLLLGQTNCSDFGTPIENVIYFVNGVDNSPSQMRASSDELKKAVGNTSKNRFSIAKNRSDMFLIVTPNRSATSLTL